LCTWELGGGYGHLHRIAAIALKLRERGHEIIVAVRDLPAASGFRGLAGFPLLQAPIFMRSSQLPPSINYAELLNRVGYLDAQTLAGLIGAWRELVRLVHPALVLVDYSPTALIAARLENTKRVSIGTGFMHPPRTVPMPTMQPWRQIGVGDLMRAESEVLERVNAAIANHRGAPLSALHEILDVDRYFLCTFAEFDHYGPRAEPYWGPLDLSVSGKAPIWPGGSGPRIFAYYRAGYPHLSELMRQLSILDAPTLAVIDGASRSLVSQFSAGSVRVETEQVNLAAVAEFAAAAFCHAGAGTVTQLALGGCPVVMLPASIEQMLFAYRVNQSGLGTNVQMEKGVPDFLGAFRRILDRPVYRERAKAVARRYAGITSEAQAARIAELCGEVIGVR
jgi:hypothetical protein